MRAHSILRGTVMQPDGLPGLDLHAEQQPCQKIQSADAVAIHEPALAGQEYLHPLIPKP